MVSLSEESDRARSHFFEKEEEEDLLTESATLSIDVNTEQTGRTINTTWVIFINIILVLGVWVCIFLLPVLCESNKCGTEPVALILYIIGGVWFLQLLIDRYYRNQHYKIRLCGYLSFYRRTRNIRRMPLIIASAATACLLITCQILSEKCKAGTVKCGPLHKDGYIQIIVSISCAIQIILLVIYSVRTINFNKSGASPDVNQEEMVTSFLQTNSITTDVGFRDGGLMDQVLERQADMIRYLKQHNEQLSKKIIVLSEENQSLKQRRQ
ncbi:transmembrane protein 192-like isoform X2 [Ruditapes philippinarum]|uniref:transmembrane protein 192-like isoform X2 n=1 Tax=Ruditapes philippinarum TaxID=129788 RepID=UPI00295AD018|nr:transmembrane protein 192-like isoform X2 [Ruditapes philippinarum]